ICLITVKMRMSQEMIQFPVVLFIPEILRQPAGDYRSDPVNGAYLFFTGPADLIQIVAEMPADHLCVGKADIGDPKTVDHFGRRRFSRFLQTVHKVFKGFFPESLHGNDLVTVFSDLENISEVVNKTSGNKLLQRSLGQPVNIHGVPADKKGRSLDLLGDAVRIHTVEGFYFVFFYHPGFLPTHRTDIRYRKIAASCKILRDLGNDHIGLILLYGISHPQFKLLYNAYVVNAGAAYCGSLKFHRIKNGDGVDQTGP